MSLSKTDKLQIRTIVVGLFLIITTSLSIYFLYGFFYFQKWPWFKFSIIMSVLTCLWTYAFWFFRITGGDKNTLHAMFFGLIVIPFDFLLLYPGAENIGLYSDSIVYYFIIVLEIQHGIGFYIIQRGIIKYLELEKLWSGLDN